MGRGSVVHLVLERLLLPHPFSLVEEVVGVQAHARECLLGRLLQRGEVAREHVQRLDLVGDGHALVLQNLGHHGLSSLDHRLGFVQVHEMGSHDLQRRLLLGGELCLALTGLQQGRGRGDFCGGDLS